MIERNRFVRTFVGSIFVFAGNSFLFFHFFLRGMKRKLCHTRLKSNLKMALDEKKETRGVSELSCQKFRRVTLAGLNRAISSVLINQHRSKSSRTTPLRISREDHRAMQTRFRGASSRPLIKTSPSALA